MQFSYVLAGWEGSAHDMRVLFAHNFNRKHQAYEDPSEVGLDDEAQLVARDWVEGGMGSVEEAAKEMDGVDGMENMRELAACRDAIAEEDLNLAAHHLARFWKTDAPYPLLAPSPAGEGVALLRSTSTAAVPPTPAPPAPPPPVPGSLPPAPAPLPGIATTAPSAPAPAAPASTASALSPEDVERAARAPTQSRFYMPFLHLVFGPGEAEGPLDPYLELLVPYWTVPGQVVPPHQATPQAAARHLRDQ
jgi:hypothetical protein